MIYLNLNDLNEEKRMELFEMACDEVREEMTEEEKAEYGDMTEDIVSERADNRLIAWSHEGRFVFNV